MERDEILEEAAWAAHCWIVDAALSGRLAGMLAPDMSVAIGQAIKAAKPRSKADRELPVS